MAPDPTEASDKASWRRHLLARRRARPDADRAAAAAAVAAGLVDVLDATSAAGDAVCLHVPVRGEPGVAPDGSLPLLDAAVALGRRVLLPVVADAPGGGGAPLDWARYRDRTDLVPGPFGLLQPAGERLGAAAVGDAAAVVVPALAVDAAGVRLGRGGGHYDRTLPAVAVARRVVLVFDDEVVDVLPAEPHDARMGVVWRALAGPAAVAGAGTGAGAGAPAGAEQRGVVRG